MFCGWIFSWFQISLTDAKKESGMEKRESFAHALCAIFEKRGLISPKESHLLQDSFKKSTKEAFDDFLLEEGLMSKENILKALSELYQVPAVDVTGYFFESFLLRKFPKDVLHRNAFIPMQVDENIMAVVASEPDDPRLLPIIGRNVSYDIQFRVGIRRDITDAISEYYDTADTEIQEDVDLRQERGQAQQERKQELEEERPISNEDVLD